MWVFGYGSLMWDGWEATRGCVRRARADLRGYRRVFNKASVRNWGTKEFPGPTLNLIKSDSAHCYGIAFEFSDEREQDILRYLTNREGKGFFLRKILTQLDTGDTVIAVVPVYEGANLIYTDRIEYLANMILQARGKDGACIGYIKGIAEELHRLGIDDPAVSELWRAVVQRGRNPQAS